MDVSDSDIESLVPGSAETGFHPARLVNTAVDPTLRAASNASRERGPPQASYRSVT
jgi:hypothetical protein